MSVYNCVLENTKKIKKIHNKKNKKMVEKKMENCYEGFKIFKAKVDALSEGICKIYN